MKTHGYKLFSAISACLVLVTPLVTAQPLVTGPGVAIGAADLESDIQRVPPQLRVKTFSDPEAVRSNITNLYVRRVLAIDALRDGSDRDPAVKAALDLARDKILSDVQLSKLDKATMPGADALQAYAEAMYKANPRKYEVPEQVKIRHILIRAVEPNAKTLAEQLLKDLRGGASFEELAKTRSQDPGSAAQGGDLGLVPRGKMIKQFEDAAFMLTQPGALSNVVETQFGFHIIKLDERRPAGTPNFQVVKETILKEAQNILISKARQDEKDRILSSAKFDDEAIKAFADAKAKENK